MRERFDHRNLNVDVPEFADGALIPTGENLARLVAERVQRGLDAAAQGGPTVTRVVVAEDETLSVTYEPGRDA